MNAITMFAQAMDPISGGAGWLGAGLLGLVLGWLLLLHLPAKDKQIKDLLDASNTRLDTLIDKHNAAMERAQILFRESLDTVVEHCEKEMAKLTAEIRGRRPEQEDD